MKELVWRVEYTSPPKAVRYCKKCGAKSEFMSSGLFRINAQQKYLDIWLVYKCSHCDSTWNCEIYTRVNPKSLSNELLELFHANDEKLALEYAMDTGLLIKNGAERLTLPEYQVFGEAVDLASGAVLRIVSGYSTDVKISAMLREKLGLSRSAFDRMLQDGKIRCDSGHDLRKAKLHGEITITLGV